MIQRQKALQILLSFNLFILIINSSNAQNFPKLGNDTLLDVACWNTEWLGDATNGPSDEATQYNNVKALIEKTDLDIIALEEISNMSTYNTLSAALFAKYDTYISTYSQTQKTGIFWRKSMFDVIGVQTLNIALNSSENYAFASRPPLQICLQTKGGTKIDTIYFLVIHMKAQTESSDAGRFESYTRRQNASIALRTYVESNLAGKKFIVLGDWNDDLDVSIYNSLETPYKNLLNANYTFPSRELTIAGKSSYAFNSNMIDHIMNSKTLDSFYYTGSAKVFDDAANYCTGFSNNTSNHYPVYAFYNWKKLTTRVIPAAINEPSKSIQVQVYPNPVESTIWFNCDKPILGYQITDMLGRAVSVRTEIKPMEGTQGIDVKDVLPGHYSLSLYTDAGVYHKLFVKL